ncbi:Fanconi anemia group G protein [Syngnathoides biaculeatus]|uniref:Fanconi anemia group G protein n=1 Tax=Syngnathoides biaculeatus TaxID=300417 RepID=UPI002ADE699C|nr:Fanconi anemia group G protein [Syngnathoides biaculeatus]
MSTERQQSPSNLPDRWLQENNELVNKWKNRDASSRDQNHVILLLSSEFQKLLRKIQGLPPLDDHVRLELCVAYNVCLLSIALSQMSEAEMLLTQTVDRVLQMARVEPTESSPPEFWRAVVTSVENEAFKTGVQNLLCVRWAIWLSNCTLEAIEGLQEEFSSLSAGLDQDVTSEARRIPSNVPLLLMEPRKLLELLQICTLITQGAERLNEGRSSEALTALHAASSLPAPRILVAYTHLLSGACLARTGRPQMALHCFRNAVETDFLCVCAQYQSVLIFRGLGDTQAEIQMLRFLHSTLMLPSTSEPLTAGDQIFSLSVLLRSPALRSLLFVPTALCVLHSLAQKCVLDSRVSEGVECYLDLLAAIHSEEHSVSSEDSRLPRLAELYLEAGTALLMAERPVDCMTLCDEVIATTAELLPERVVLEDPEEGVEESSTCADGEQDGAAMLFWTGAAYLLQGHSCCQLQDWKQAAAHYTRCINLLVKVSFKERGGQPQIPTPDMCNEKRRDLQILQRMKGLSLAGRGISFAQTDQLRHALRNLQLSLHAFPEYVNARLWCGELLWRFDRKSEAAAIWEKTWSISISSAENMPMYLREPQSGPTLDTEELRRRIRELHSG